jgi:hypothetical protein
MLECDCPQVGKAGEHVEVMLIERPSACPRGHRTSDMATPRDRYARLTGGKSGLAGRQHAARQPFLDRESSPDQILGYAVTGYRHIGVRVGVVAHEDAHPPRADHLGRPTCESGERGGDVTVLAHGSHRLDHSKVPMEALARVPEAKHDH